jgi:hypothetical protein
MAVDYATLAAMLGHSSVARFYARSPDPYLLAHLRVSELSAMRELGRGLDDLAREVAEARLALYREYVGSTVTRVSPLLLRWCELERVEVDDLAWRLAPDRPWTPWLCGPRPPDPSRPMKRSFRARPSERGEADFHELQRFAFSGTVIRPGAKLQGFGLRVLHDRLELGAFIGSARIRTFGRGGAIVLPGELPATLLVGLPGTPLDRLVDHPLLNGAGCVVRGVDEPTRSGTRITFALSSEPWRMPWAREAR